MVMTHLSGTSASWFAGHAVNTVRCSQQRNTGISYVGIVVCQELLDTVDKFTKTYGAAGK